MDPEKAPLLDFQKIKESIPRRVRRASQLSFSKTVKTVTDDHKLSRKYLVGYILMTQFFDKLISDGLNGGIVLFCTNVLLFPSAEAATVDLVFMGKLR